MKKKKVIVALSGGVDSSTAAALLIQAGFVCEGVFIITSNQSFHSQKAAENAAKKLQIKLHVLDLISDFNKILEYFCDQYSKARTPNPCVLCNKLIKFGKVWEFSQKKGTDFISTGHYARILRQNGHIGLYEASDPAKDQSYALSMIDKKILPKIILPLGDYTKTQTRKMAANFGLETEHKAESQEICFIPNNDYVSILEKMRPELARKGKIINSSGKVLGQHNGIHKFTIGQRRGLRVAMGEPYYVVKIDVHNNTVTLGPKQELKHRCLWATDVNWLIDKPASPFRAKVKIRYNNSGTSAMICPQDDGIAIEFDEDKLAITPGQLAVFYTQQGKDNRVIGAGWIDRAYD